MRLLVRRRRMMDVALRRIDSLGSNVGLSVRPISSRFSSVLASVAVSTGTRIPASAAILFMPSTNLPREIFCRLTSRFCPTNSTTCRVNAFSSHSSFFSLTAIICSAASSPRPSLTASSIRNRLSCSRGERRPTIPRSISASDEFSVSKMFPGCGSAWKKPSTSICFKYA